jgi:hypothetical protein
MYYRKSINKSRFSLTSLFFAFLILLLYFENYLQEILPILSYLDEVVALGGLIYYFLHIRKSAKNKIILVVIAIFLMVFGVLFNIIYQFQPYKIAIIEDIFSIFKFLFVYLGFSEFTRQQGINKYDVARALLPIIKIHVLILAVCALINMLHDSGFTAAGTDSMRYGLREFAFIYGTPGHVINQMTYSLLLLNAQNYKKNKKWCILCLIVMAATLKTRAFLLILVYIVLWYFTLYRKKKRLRTEIILVLILVIFAGYSQFEFYFLSGVTPRSRFLKGAIQIAKTYFPFGTGFATFGSSGAAEYYSGIYYKLGWGSLRGMSPLSTEFLNDNYFPMILAQFGVIGGAVFCYMLYLYCRDIWLTIDKESAIIKFSSLFYILDILLSSVQSSYLAHYSVVTLTLIYCICYLPNRKEQYDY